MLRIPPPPPKGRRLLGVITESIARGEIREGEPQTFLSYSTALERLGARKPRYMAGARLGNYGLRDLNNWTQEFSELPKVAALIVDRKYHQPNRRMAESHGIKTDGAEWLVWWQDQANRSIRFDWSPYVEGATFQLRAKVEPRVSFAVAEGAPALAPDVRDVLRWLAAGQSEAEILRLHPDLTVSDIRDGLKLAAERLENLDTRRAGHRGASFAQRWRGKFTLPQPDPSDPRLTYLLERYLRHDR